MQANEIILLKLTLAYAQIQCLEEQRKRIEAYLAVAKTRVTEQEYEFIANYFSDTFTSYQKDFLTDLDIHHAHEVLFRAKAWLLRREAITPKDWDKLEAQEKELKLSLFDYIPRELWKMFRQPSGRCLVKVKYFAVC